MAYFLKWQDKCNGMDEEHKAIVEENSEENYTEYQTAKQKHELQTTENEKFNGVILEWQDKCNEMGEEHKAIVEENSVEK